MKRVFIGFLVILVFPASYVAWLAFSPSHFDPQSWQSPMISHNYGAKPFPPLNVHPLPAGMRDHEHLSTLPDGSLIGGLINGQIIRWSALDAEPKVFATLKGRPLGFDVSLDGTVYVADAFNGLYKVNLDGEVSLLADAVEDGSPIRYANSVAVHSSGRIFFTDASQRYAAKDHGTYPASILDLIDHHRTGRVLMYDPDTQKTIVVKDGFSFANGLALTPDESELLVVETGEYRVHRLSIEPENWGESELLIGDLPGFPDNLHPTENGYWLGIVAPRNGLIDRLAQWPKLRTIVGRLPEWLRPKATRFGRLIHLNEEGEITHHYVDPTGALAFVTSAVTGDFGVCVAQLHGGSLSCF